MLKIQSYMRKHGWNHKEIQDLMKKVHNVKSSVITAGTLFNYEDTENIVDRLMKALQFPYKMIQVSTLGGKERASIIIKATLESKDKWPIGIFHNASYAIFHLNSDGVLEQSHQSGSFPKMRKTRIKDVPSLIKKLNGLSK